MAPGRKHRPRLWVTPWPVFRCERSGHVNTDLQTASKGVVSPPCGREAPAFDETFDSSIEASEAGRVRQHVNPAASAASLLRCYTSNRAPKQCFGWGRCRAAPLNPQHAALNFSKFSRNLRWRARNMTIEICGLSNRNVQTGQNVLYNQKWYQCGQKTKKNPYPIDVTPLPCRLADVPFYKHIETRPRTSSPPLSAVS